MQKIGKILWPTYLYLIVLVIFYEGRGIDTPLLVNEIIIFFAPILLFGLTLLLARKTYKKLSNFASFAYCLIPGALFGLQLANGLTALAERGARIGDLPFFLVTALLFAFASGGFGFFVNFVINKFSKK
jgi:hypothetical protein